MSEEKSLVKSLEDLNKALEAGSYTKSVTPLLVNNEFEVAKQYLTPEALNALRLSPKAKQLLGFDIHGVPVAKAVYFSVTAKNKNIEKAVKKMADIANDLAAQGLIHSILAPISTVQLAKMPGQELTSAAFFFPLVPLDKVDYVKESSEFSTEEGEIGKAVDALELEQGDGEFFAVERISHVMTMMRDNFDPKKHMDQLVEFYLKVLPAGTKFLSCESCAIVDTSIPYELKFSNPLLPKVKRIELEFVREFATLDGKIHDFNVFTGIKFYDKDDKEIYKRS